MLKIDDNLLQEIGLGALPIEDKRGLLTHIYETLEMRVGMRLADQMTNEQLDEFERYFEAKDDAGAFKWLETNFPNYKDIVNEEFEKLKSEVTQNVPQILAASTSNAAAGAVPAPGTDGQQGAGPAPIPMQQSGPQQPAFQPQPPQGPPQQPYQQPTPPQPPVVPAQGYQPPAAPAPAQPYAAPPQPGYQQPQPPAPTPYQSPAPDQPDPSSQQPWQPQPLPPTPPSQPPYPPETP